MTARAAHRPLRAASALALAGVLLLAGCGGVDPGAGAARGTRSTAVLSAATPTSSTTTAPTDPTAAEPGDDGLSSADELGSAPPEDLFSVESPWNVSVLDEPVAPYSATLLAHSALRTRIGPDGTLVTAPVTAGLQVNTRGWTVPVVAGGVPTVVTCRQVSCGDGSGSTTLDVPAGVDPDPLHDGWFTVVDPRTGTAYDLWRARREADGSLSYLLMRTWDVAGPGFSQPDVPGARGSGLPLAAGLIRPGELERCQIHHALAISLPGPAAGYYVQPASTTNGTNDVPALPEGARIRLRAGVRLRDPVDPVTRRPLPFTPARRELAGCIVTALQDYGAIVVDRAAVPTLYFQLLPPVQGRRPLLNGYELSSLGLDDFEALDFSDQARFPFPADGTR